MPTVILWPPPKYISEGNTTVNFPLEVDRVLRAETHRLKRFGPECESGSLCFALMGAGYRVFLRLPRSLTDARETSCLKDSFDQAQHAARHSRRAPEARSIPENRQKRIIAAARKLNYQPNFRARSLRAQRTSVHPVLRNRHSASVRDKSVGLVQ